jgi:hypothetical protein
VSVRVAFILRAAMVYVASRLRQVVPGMGGTIIPAWVERQINLWLAARQKAIVALIQRIEAGTQKPPRPYKAREAKPAGAGPAAERKSPALRMPTSFGWLRVVGRELRLPGQQLAMLLDEDMRAMVIAHPQLGTLIRPVLRMMGEEAPAWFPKAPKRARSNRRNGPARRRTQPDAEIVQNVPSRDLGRYIATEHARQYAADIATLYDRCGGPPPEVAKRLARLIRRAAPPLPAGATPTPARAPAPAPTPTPAVPVPPAEEPVDRDKYYYAETWNGKLIPVRRRWGW